VIPAVALQVIRRLLPEVLGVHGEGRSDLAGDTVLLCVGDRAAAQQLDDPLSYNIVTNGGNTFLGTKDDEKLREIMRLVTRELADRYASSTAA
jgi:hypothetical protein